MTQRFEWEDIDDYERLTGIEGLDKALVYADPVGPLKDHFGRTERERGREAVAAELVAIVEATPPGSPAHDGCSSWLSRYEGGANIEDL